MAKKLRPPKGIGPRRKEEIAYYKAIKRNVLNPLLRKTTERLASVPPIKIAYKNMVDLIFVDFVSGPIAEEIAIAHLNKLRRIHKARMIKAFQAALGVNVNPFMSDLAIRPLMQEALAANIDLIVSIPKNLNDQVLASIERIFEKQGFVDQHSMSKILERDFKVTDRRARFIARDQTEKIIGDLNQERQTSLGIKSYTWQTSMDELVVGNPSGAYPIPTPGHGDHFSRNGKEFLWSAPPDDGHPGYAFNCRCIAAPVIPGIENEQFTSSSSFMGAAA